MVFSLLVFSLESSPFQLKVFFSAFNLCFEFKNIAYKNDLIYTHCLESVGVNEAEMAEREACQEKKLVCRFSSEAHLNVRRLVCKKFILSVFRVLVKVIYCRKYLYYIIAEAETRRRWLKP